MALKQIFEEMEERYGLDLSGSGDRQLVGPYDHVNEPSDSIKY
jgi:hypothetical protein